MIDPSKPLAVIVLLLLLAFSYAEADPVGPGTIIRVQTDHCGLMLFVGKDGRLYESSFGGRSTTEPEPPKNGEWQKEFYPQAGDGYIAEPALSVTHSDGNISTELIFVKFDIQPISQGVEITRILLKDPAYPDSVTLCFKTYASFDVIEEWTEIQHGEPGPIQLDRFASAAPFIDGDLYMTQFHGDYASEMNPSTEHLTSGIKIIDSKLSVRADYYRNPSFLLTRGGPPQENSGQVWAGCLEWPGSFQFAFESDFGVNRALCGINPFSSSYKLEAGRVFQTPAMVWAWSGSGVGPLSRNLHRWARQFAVRDGNRPRAVLLNNWEATHTDFNEQKLITLFDGARDLGLDLFLLDDGWFGVKYPRNGDNSGLGDWQPDPKKLPNGMGALCDAAKSRGLRFGIWMEPEMVNPRSFLYEQHPDWVVQQSHRPLRFMRNQLVLDLSRPEVKEYVFKCLDDLFTQNPGVSYVKWDCNRYLTQPGSTWLTPGHQTELDIDYNFALLEIMKSIAQKHSGVEMMVCAGGGGRVDYGSLRYFDEFWPSDNTDPLRRVTMQWDYSTFFPAITISGHVTRWGNRPIKFAFDVAMSVRMGMDMDLSKLSPDEIAFAKTAVATYKSHVLSVVQFGDLYRIENPHNGPRSVLDYVSADGSRAILFLLQNGTSVPMPAKPQGLDPARRYLINELDLPAGVQSSLAENGQIVAGEKLMKEGLHSNCSKPCDSLVVEFVSQQ